MKKRPGITLRLGPLGLSLLAAAITAIGVAAVSMADSGGSGAGTSGQPNTRRLPPPPGGGPGVMMLRSNLSAADRQKLEDFRKCMDENGAPAPPTHVDPSQGPPKPPSADEQQKIQKAYEACKDKLPERMQNAGPPRIGQCGPPPGLPQQGRQQGRNQNQSYQPGVQSIGSSS